MRVGRVAAVCWCVGLSLPGAARAADRTVGIDYQAPADCPPADEFVALLAARTEGTWRVRQGAGELRFAVQIRQLPAGTVGRLQRSSVGRVSEAREVTGADCREVVRALALTTALSLDTEPAPAIVVSAPAATARASIPGAAPAAWSVGLGLGASGPMPDALLGEVAA